MIIVGAKGFAKELLEVCYQLGRTENLVFFDNVSTELPELLFNQFPILRSKEEVKQYLHLTDRSFALGLGKPEPRRKMAQLIESWGGELTSLISPKASISHFGVHISAGATILNNATITSDVKIGQGILMYPNSIITHDCVVGDFVELSPGATILGNCLIESGTHIGANATVLPKVRVGKNVVIGAGAVVTKDLVKDVTVKGIPAR
jgi:sugar O-acyltransferase (sialic acid O-acetyltransferase NeuD family)